MRLLNGGGGLGDLFVAIASQHQVILRLGDGHARFGLQQRIFIGRFIQHPQRLPAFNGIAFVNAQRGETSAHAEAHVHRTNIHVTVQRQAFILMALIPQPSTDSGGKQNNNHQNDGDRFFHDFRLLCVKPCRIRST